MTYKIAGHNVTLKLTAEELGEVITALSLTAPDSELLQAFQEFRAEEIA
jgi:hypothetical protein